MCCSNQAARKALQGAACACLEQLEVRRLMSVTTSYKQPKEPDPCSYEQYDSNKDRCKETLRIRGTNCDDKITIYDDPKCNTVTVWEDKNRDCRIDECELKTFYDVEKIEVDAKDGDDKVAYVLAGDLCREKRSIKVDLGCGDDCFELGTGYAPRVKEAEAVSLTSEEECEPYRSIESCADFCIDVKGGDGCDKLDFDFSHISIKDSKVTIKADAGKGNDCVEYELPSISEANGAPTENMGALAAAGEKNGDSGGPAIISDSTVKATFKLGDGCNTMKIRTETFMIDSCVETCVIGGKDKDSVYDEEAYGLLGCTKYSVKVDLGKGNDEYCQSFNPQSFIDCKASACFEVKGGDGCDEIKVRAQRVVYEPAPPVINGVEEGPKEIFNGIQGLLSIKLDGGCDNDKVSIDLSCVALHVGDKGKLKLGAEGGDGKDCVEVVARVDECSSGCYEICVSGGKGDDKVALGFQDDSCGFNGPLLQSSSKSSKSRYDLKLDGGSGCDEWDTEGNKGEEVCPRNVERLCEGLLPPFCDRLIDAA